MRSLVRGEMWRLVDKSDNVFHVDLLPKPGVFEQGVASGENHTVDDFEAERASKFNKIQTNSNSSPQRLQYQSIRNSRIPRISIIDGTWFGTRGSEVQILSPRPTPD